MPPELDNRVPAALLILRFFLAVFLLQWSIEKLILPDAAVRIASNFYGVTLPVQGAYALGAAELIVSLALLFGFYRTISYGPSLLIHTVTISTPTAGAGVNDYGDPNEGTPTTVQEVVRIQPARRLDFFIEELTNRDTRKTRHTLFAQPDSTVTALSTVIWGSRTFKVVSRPAVVWGAAEAHHVEALLEEIEG